MKNLIILFSFFSMNAFAQVGINNPNPIRTLDVNGDLSVKALEYKNSDPNYNKVLVTNSAGEIEYWDKQDIKDKVDNLYVVNKKFTISTTGPDTNLIVPCGKFQFRYNNPVMPQIKLVDAPSANIDVYYSRIRKRNNKSADFTTGTGRSLNTNQVAKITTANNWVDIGVSGDTTANFSNETLDEYYITYPGNVNMYRVTFLARSASRNSISYSMICERF